MAINAFESMDVVDILIEDSAPAGGQGGVHLILQVADKPISDTQILEIANLLLGSDFVNDSVPGNSGMELRGVSVLRRADITIP